MKCHWCGESLQFRRGRGWIHREGGTYKARCRTCGWMGAPYPTPTRCPKCGSKEVVDDHCALPVPDEVIAVGETLSEREYREWRHAEWPEIEWPE